MRTAFILPAAALAAIGYGLVLPPTAQAIPIPSCSEQLAELQARLGQAVPLPAGMAAACDAQQQQEFAKAGQPQPTQKPAAPPPPPSGPLPCTPAAPGVNGNCGFTYSQCAVGALTGVGPCPEGAAGPPPQAPPQPALAPPTPPAAPPTGPEINVPAAPSPNDGQPVDPGQCTNLDYYVKFKLYCATVGPPPAGWHPGMGS
jgi:hypothetical protein